MTCVVLQETEDPIQCIRVLAEGRPHRSSFLATRARHTVHDSMWTDERSRVSNGPEPSLPCCRRRCPSSPRPQRPRLRRHGSTGPPPKAATPHPGASTPRGGNSSQAPHRQPQTGTGKEKHQNNSQAPHCRSPRGPHPPSGPRHHPARSLPRALRCSETELCPHQQRRCSRRIPPSNRAVPAAGIRPRSGGEGEAAGGSVGGC